MNKKKLTTNILFGITSISIVLSAFSIQKYINTNREDEQKIKPLMFSSSMVAILSGIALHFYSKK